MITSYNLFLKITSNTMKNIFLIVKVVRERPQNRQLFQSITSIIGSCVSLVCPGTQQQMQLQQQQARRARRQLAADNGNGERRPPLAVDEEDDVDDDCSEYSFAEHKPSAGCSTHHEHHLDRTKHLLLPFADLQGSPLNTQKHTH